MYGGFHFGVGAIKNDLAAYDIASNSWLTNFSSTPNEARYEHSTVAWGESLLVFGGKLIENEETVDELWQFNTNFSTWTRVLYTSNFGNGNNGSNLFLKLAGHTANMVRLNNGSEKMVVLFGYHPTMGFNRMVYEYDPTGESWNIITPTGALIWGIFGHSTVYDPTNGLLYIHGGMLSGGSLSASSALSDRTMSYNPNSNEFKLLRSSGVPRYLHTAVFLNGTMFVYGGSTHNDTSVTSTALCFSDDFMVYDLRCNR